MLRRSRMVLAIAIAVLGSACMCCKPAHKEEHVGATNLRVLVFSKTAGFRHDSIPAGIAAVHKLGEERNWHVHASEDAATFTSAQLARFDVIVFLNTSGTIFDEEQKAAFQGFVRAGGGFVGIHAAADTEHDWPWYGQLIGARFASHPHIQPAVIEVIDCDHPSSRHLPPRWERTDEWYNFDAHPRARLGVRLRMLAQLDETSYGGGSMGADHPFTWCHEFDGGRAWYTAGGHTIESFVEPVFIEHIAGGIQWSAQTRLRRCID